MENIFNTYKKNQEDLGAEKLSSFLSDKGIVFQAIRCVVSPSILLYEIVPLRETRVSEILSLKNDIALLLKTDFIHIIPAFRDKGTFAIEVKNNNPYILGVREVIKDAEASSKKLPVLLGTDTQNKILCEDLTQLPHLLIAGATGQGKSVSIHSIVSGLIWHKKPSEVKFVFIDPKLVEFSIYAKLPDYQFQFGSINKSILTEPNDILTALNALIEEMNNRYKILESYGKRKIEELEIDLPYIVVIIDEFADILSYKGLSIEKKVIKLAQKSRAVGIHLILSTQRPSVKVISGEIKANFPARIAFKCVSRGDSQTVLGYAGAEKLFGNGDGLFLFNASIIRFQGAYVTIKETERLIDFINHRNMAAPQLVSHEEIISNDLPNDILITNEMEVEVKPELQPTRVSNHPVYYKNEINEVELFQVIKSKYDIVGTIRNIRFKHLPLWKICIINTEVNIEKTLHFYHQSMAVLSIYNQEIIFNRPESIDLQKIRSFEEENFKALDEQTISFYNQANPVSSNFKEDSFNLFIKDKTQYHVKSVEKCFYPYWECTISTGETREKQIFVDAIFGYVINFNGFVTSKSVLINNSRKEYSFKSYYHEME